MKFVVALLCADGFGFLYLFFFFFQAEDGIRDLVRSRGLGDVYKRQGWRNQRHLRRGGVGRQRHRHGIAPGGIAAGINGTLSLIHI